MRRLLRFLLITTFILFVVRLGSNSFDPDLGWHLQFGQSFWQNHIFPFTDLATWSHYGQIWINHEWGGDLLLWPIYHHFGYFALLVATSLPIIVGFLFVHWSFRKKITTSALLASFFSLWSVEYIIIPRLAMVTPLFLAVLLASLERARSAWVCLTIPLTMYAWSLLHGSWALGFIVIGIYLTGRFAANLNRDDRLPFWKKEAAEWRPLIYMFIGGGLAALVILINPYGSALYREIWQYFNQNSFKNFIDEWRPSYTFPIYWQSLVLVGISLPAFALTAIRRQLTITHTFLYLAFLIAGLQAKRNMMLLAIISAPLLSTAGTTVWGKIRKKIPDIAQSMFVRKTIFFFGTSAAILAILFNLLEIQTGDIWKNTALLNHFNMPVGAIQFLAREPSGPIFNYFSWGGYLDWNLPQDKIFIDGRGTVTWRWNQNQTLLEKYWQLVYDPKGLTELNKGPTRYILLPATLTDVSVPENDYLNRWLFPPGKWPYYYQFTETKLEKELDNSPRWKKIYSDGMANIWEKII